MNQILKDVVYSMGSKKQVEFLSRLGGMNEIEHKLLMGIHNGETDLSIQMELGLSRDGFKRTEDAMRKKALLAVFNCINYRIAHDEEDLS